MEGLPQRVHDEGKGGKEGNEGYYASVEEALGREHIGQLQVPAQGRHANYQVLVVFPIRLRLEVPQDSRNCAL